MAHDCFQPAYITFSRIAQINFVMVSCVRNIQLISVCFHIVVHEINGGRLIIVRADVHTLNTQTLIIREELYFGEILFLLFRCFLNRPLKIFLRYEVRQPIIEIKCISSFLA